MTQITDAHVEHPTAPTMSTWQPLRQRVFRMLWIATVVSNVGSWMSDVGVNWSMLTLSADPLDIALVQAASSLPMFLFALPSGVMADIVDRRKYLLFSQLWMFIAAAGLAIIAASRAQSAALLPMILTLIGAFGWAIGNVSARMARPRQPLQLTLWMSIVPVVPLAILSALFEGPRIGPALATAFTPGALSANLGLLYIVIFASVVGYGIWNTMMARYPASVVAPFSHAG